MIIIEDGNTKLNDFENEDYYTNITKLFMPMNKVNINLIEQDQTIKLEVLLNPENTEPSNDPSIEPVALEYIKSTGIMPPINL